MNEYFRKFAHRTSEIVGSPQSFIRPVAMIVSDANPLDPST
jgi:low affinity Fe/Cu permease